MSAPVLSGECGDGAHDTCHDDATTCPCACHAARISDEEMGRIEADAIALLAALRAERALSAELRDARDRMIAEADRLRVRLRATEADLAEYRSAARARNDIV